MKNDKLLQAIGKIDDELVYGAVNDTKAKKNTWIKWGAMAACLCLIVGAVFAIPNMRNINETPVGTEIDNPAPDDYYESVSAIPMVFVNDKLYVQAYDGTIISEKQDNFIDLGKITSNVLSDEPNSDGIPTKNLQTNQAIVGCDVYQNGDDIVVYVENIGYMVFVEYGGPDTDMWNEAFE